MGGSRATHSLTLHALRYLRRQIYSVSKVNPLFSSTRDLAKNACLPSPVEAGTKRGLQVYGAYLEKGSELEVVSRYEGADDFVFRREPPSSRHLEMLLEQVRSKDMDTVNDKICDIQEPIRANTSRGLGQGVLPLTDQYFLARYVQWRHNDRLGSSQQICTSDVSESLGSSPSPSSSADVSPAGLDDPFLFVRSQNCVPDSQFFHCPSLDMHQDHMPLEASSVKRKRKKKMNKHKQRKLRRRDRHRN